MLPYALPAELLTPIAEPILVTPASRRLSCSDVPTVIVPPELPTHSLLSAPQLRSSKKVQRRALPQARLPAQLHVADAAIPAEFSNASDVFRAEVLPCGVGGDFTYADVRAAQNALSSYGYEDFFAMSSGDDTAAPVSYLQRYMAVTCCDDDEWAPPSVQSSLAALRRDSAAGTSLGATYQNCTVERTSTPESKGCPDAQLPTSSTIITTAATTAPAISTSDPPRVKHYSLGDRIGTWRQCGVAYKVLDERTNTVCTLCIMPKVTHRSNAAVFQGEVELLGEVSHRHPSILALHDYFADSDNVYLVFEHADEGTLETRRDNRSPVYAIQNIIRELVSALGYLHERGIAHGEVTPSSIAMHRGHVKLTNFASARRVASGKGHFPPRNVFTDLSYTSPEQLCNNVASPSADMWSLGVLCYELLCGRPPFLHASRDQTAALIANGVMRFPSHLSDEAQSFIMGLLSVEERSRLSARQAQRHPFLSPTPLDAASLAAPGEKKRRSTVSERSTSLIYSPFYVDASIFSVRPSLDDAEESTIKKEGMATSRATATVAARTTLRPHTHSSERRSTVASSSIVSVSTSTGSRSPVDVCDISVVSVDVSALSCANSDATATALSQLSSSSPMPLQRLDERVGLATKAPRQFSGSVSSDPHGISRSTHRSVSSPTLAQATNDTRTGAVVLTDNWLSPRRLSPSDETGGSDSGDGCAPRQLSYSSLSDVCVSAATEVTGTSLHPPMHDSVMDLVLSSPSFSNIR